MGDGWRHAKNTPAFEFLFFFVMLIYWTSEFRIDITVMKNYSRISVCSMNIDLNLKKLLIRRYLMIVVAGQMKKKRKVN